MLTGICSARAKYERSGYHRRPEYCCDWVITLHITSSRRQNDQEQGASIFAVRVHVIVYAQHGHEHMGYTFPVGEPKLILHGSIITTSRRQGQTREGMSEGSPSAPIVGALGEPRTRICNLITLGTRTLTAVSLGLSSKGPYRLARTLATQSGMTNNWLAQRRTRLGKRTVD